MGKREADAEKKGHSETGKSAWVQSGRADFGYLKGGGPSRTACWTPMRAEKMPPEGGGGGVHGVKSEIYDGDQDV